MGAEESRDKALKDAANQANTYSYQQITSKWADNPWAMGRLNEAYAGGGMEGLKALADQFSTGEAAQAKQKEAESASGKLGEALKKQAASRTAENMSALRGQMGSQGIRGGEAGRFMTNLAAKGEQSMQGIDADLGYKLKQLQHAAAQNQMNRSQQMNLAQMGFQHDNEMLKRQQEYADRYKWLDALTGVAGAAGSWYGSR